MFDGVGWAAGEIVVFMLIATLIGFAIGWIFGRWLQKGTISDEYESALALERERSKKAEERFGASKADLDKALLEVKAERGKLEGVTAELDTTQAAAAELDTTLGLLGERDAEIERLSTDLAAKAELDAELEAESAAKAELEAQLAAMAGMDGEITRLAANLEACDADRKRLSNEAAQSADQRAADKERIASLEAELEIAAAAVATTPEVVAPGPEVVQPQREPEPSKEEGLARIAEIAARTAGDGPVADDDLKKIHGVGPKLERTLKGLGITSFRQIANFQKNDIAYVTAALDAFKGRIERDDWMSSAAAEHAKKYNEPA